MIDVNSGLGVKVVMDPVEVISTEKVLLKVQPGCLWTELVRDGRQVGAVIHGSAEYVFDAIAETEEGALGRSFRGEIAGYKIYVGGSDLHGSSRAASHEEILTSEFSNAEAFIEGAREALGLINLNYDNNISSPGGSGEGIVIWSDNGVKKNIITSKGDSHVFVKDKTVYTLSDEKYVMIDDDRVSIRSPGGKELIIDRGEIIEPEELRNLGPRIAKEVSDSLKDLKFSMKWRRRGDIP